jgi:hypothetical protein
VIGLGHPAKSLHLICGYQSAPSALHGLEFSASHHTVERRAAQANKYLKLCERIAEAWEYDALRLHETQDDSSGSAKPTCGVHFRISISQRPRLTPLLPS